jgi:hypothetical protein
MGRACLSSLLGSRLLSSIKSLGLIDSALRAIVGSVLLLDQRWSDSKFVDPVPCEVYGRFSEFNHDSTNQSSLNCRIVGRIFNGCPLRQFVKNIERGELRRFKVVIRKNV